jgi:hypothetical protein
MNTAAMSDENILIEIAELECEAEGLQREIIDCERQCEDIASEIAALRATLKARDAAASADAMVDSTKLNARFGRPRTDIPLGKQKEPRQCLAIPSKLQLHSASSATGMTSTHRTT